MGGPSCAWTANGARVRCEAESTRAEPPLHINYGGSVGDASHQLLARSAFEEQLNFNMSASLMIGTPELQRGLPLENLAPEHLPEELMPPAELIGALSDAIRAGHTPISNFYIAPDAHGGHGLYAATELPRHAMLGEYVGALRREISGCDIESDAGAHRLSKQQDLTSIALRAGHLGGHIVD